MFFNTAQYIPNLIKFANNSKGLEKKKILIIDDDKDVWTLFERILGDSFNICCLPYIYSCDDIPLEFKHPDLAIIDINLEQDNGHVLGTMLQQTQPKKMPIIYISSDKNNKKLIQNGPHSNSFFLSKPFQRDTLSLTICNFLNT